MRVARWFSISRLEYSWRHVVGPCPRMASEAYTVEPSHSLSCCEFTQTISHGPFFVPSLKEIWDFRKTWCKVAGKSNSIYTNKCKKIFRRDLSLYLKPKRMFTSIIWTSSLPCHLLSPKSISLSLSLYLSLHEVMIWTHEWSINILIVEMQFRSSNR